MTLLKWPIWGLSPVVRTRVLTLSDGHLHVEAFGVNKARRNEPDSPFGSKFDRLRNAAGGAAAQRAAMPKRPKAAPNPASRKSNVFNEQVRYAARRAAGYKKHAAAPSAIHGHRHFVDPAKRLLHGLQKRQQRGPSIIPRRKSPLSGKTLDDDAAAVVGQLQANRASTR